MEHDFMLVRGDRVLVIAATDIKLRKKNFD